MVQLQVLVSCYGWEGLERLARTKRPQVKGVAYLVSCQLPNNENQLPSNENPTESQAVHPQTKSPQLQAFLQREDVSLHIIHSKGLSLNRNNALRLATAPLCLLSDDDVDYESHQLQAIIEAFHTHPQADAISFQYHCPQNEKTYPKQSFNHRKAPKGFYISSIEIAFRREKVQGHIPFNEFFGNAQYFSNGEDDLFMHDMLAAGLNVIFLPTYICTHPQISSGKRLHDQPCFLQSKGAIFSRLHPKTYALRLLKEAFTQKRVSPWFFLSNTLKGVRKARRLNAFAKTTTA